MAIISNNFLYPEQWDRKILRDFDAWQLLNDNVGVLRRFGSPDVIIAIADTGGIDETHPILSGTLLDGSPKIYRAGMWDFRLMKNHNEDGVIRNDGHGTLCAGVATARAINNANEGIAGIAGNCKLMGLITLGSLTGNNLKYAEMYKWAAGLSVASLQAGFPAKISRGADIISSSYGFEYLVALPAPPAISPDIKLAFDKIVAMGRNGRGTLLFFSAGNEGRLLSTITKFDRTWAMHEKVLTVGSSSINIAPASAGFGYEEEWAGYSNFGPEVDFVTPSSSSSGFRHAPPGSWKIVTTCIQANHILTPPGPGVRDEHGGDIPGTSVISKALSLLAPSGTHFIELNDVVGVAIGQAALIGNPGAAETESANKVGAIIGNQITLKDSYSNSYINPADKFEKLKYTHNPGKVIHFGKRDYYTRHGQTSSSTPVAAGIAALILTANDKLSWVEVRHILRSTAVKIKMGMSAFLAPGPDGRWKDAAGNPVISGALTNPVNLTQAFAHNPTVHALDNIHVTSVSSYNKGDAILIEEGATSEWRYVIKVDGALNILTVDTVVNNYTVAATVKKGIKPHFSQVFGYGRLDAAAAVDAALNYDLNSRDLKIRDKLSDDGTPNNIADVINSPDIWTRTLAPVPDGANAFPPNFNTPGPSQQISLVDPTYLYARINNKGPLANPTSADNLDAWVRFYIAVSDGVPPAGEQLFNFPDFWVGEGDITKLYAAGTTVQFIDEIKFPEGLINGDNGVNTSAIKNIVWPASKKPHPDNELRTFILAHIAPFDGGLADKEVYKNNNLTYKEIFIPKIRLKDGFGVAPLQKQLDVDPGGNPSTFSLNLDFNNLPFNALNNCKIQAKMTFSDLSTQTVIFDKSSGNWAFNTPPQGNWIGLSTPVQMGPNPDFQETFRFAGMFNLSTLNYKIELHITTKEANNVVIVERDYQIDVKYNLPLPPAGVAPEKKAIFHTFTDFNLLPNQDGTANYGNVTGALDPEFRTWAAFPSTANPLKAYAVTDGECFIQEIPSTNLVNLILKPDTQPDTRYGPVKYFVYRGLKKSSFLDGTGQPLLANTLGLSDLLARMWVVRGNLNAESGLSEVLKRGDLGLDEIGDPTPTPASELIENIFDKNVFQRLTPGWYLGDFDTSGIYGLQIIVEGPNYFPKLGDVRVLDHKVIISYLPGQPRFDANQAEDIKTKLDREQILSYIDPVAYIGLFFDGKIVKHVSTGSPVTLDNPNDIYNDVISKFATADKVYVDIRNELNNSLNFYGSYTDVANTTTKVATVKFAGNNKEYHTNGWPILVLNTSDFTASTSDNFVEAIFNLPQGDNLYPGVFLSGASFFTNKLEYKDKFQVYAINSGFTDDINLSTANKPSPNNVVLPFAIKFAYTRRYDISTLPSIPGTLSRPWKDDYIENLLSPRDINIASLNNANIVQWNTLSELKYIGWTSLKGSDFTVRSGRAMDSIGEVSFAFIQGPGEEYDSILQASFTSTKSIHSNVDLERNQKRGSSFFLVLRDDLRLVRLSSIDLASPNTKVIQVDSLASTYSNDIISKSYDDVISIAYSDAEKTVIQNLVPIDFLQGSSIYLIALNHELATDANDIAFFSFDIGVQMTVYNQTTFLYEIQRVNTNIKCYSLDGKAFFTSAYSNALNNLL